MKKNLGFFISLTILLWAFYRLLFQVDWLPIFRPLDLGSVFTFFVSSPKHLLLLSICISMLCLFIFWFGKELYIWFRLSKYGEHSLGTCLLYTSSLLIPSEFRPPIPMIILSVTAIGGLIAVTVFLWIDAAFFASLLCPSELESAEIMTISAPELREILFSCLGLWLIIESVATFPEMAISIHLKYLRNSQNIIFPLLVKSFGFLIKLSLGFWLFFGRDRIKKWTSYFLKD